jgi:hypothetical protein
MFKSHQNKINPRSSKANDVYIYEAPVFAPKDFYVILGYVCT